MKNKVVKISANLGFLWTELLLPDAIYASKKNGFDAVECHWPFEYKIDDINKALEKSNLEMIVLNTQRGDHAKGENGLSAIPGRELDARKFIDQAIEYAKELNCKNVHVMAGKTSKSIEAENVFRKNLDYAVNKAERNNIIILIEPLNFFDAPNYHLTNLEKAIETINFIGAKNLKIMFDCYHIQIMQGNLFYRIKENLPDIGHIQIASVPGRNEPNKGEINYNELLEMIIDIGYQGYFGAEYKPLNKTEDGLHWLNTINL